MSDRQGEGLPEGNDDRGALQSDLEAFFAVSLSLMTITDLDGRFLRANQAFHELLGHDPASMVGAYAIDYLHPDDIPQTKDAFSRLAEGATVINFVNRFRDANNRYHSLEWQARARDGKVYASSVDATERLALENQIDEDRTFLQDVIDALPTPILSRIGRAASPWSTRRWPPFLAFLLRRLSARPTPTFHRAQKKSKPFCLMIRRY